MPIGAHIYPEQRERLLTLIQGINELQQRGILDSKATSMLNAARSGVVAALQHVQGEVEHRDLHLRDMAHHLRAVQQCRG